MRSILIHVQALVGLALAAGLSSAGEKDRQILFNGANLDGWVVEGPKQYKDNAGEIAPMWSVKDGNLVCAGRGFGFLRYQRKKFADFLLHVEYQMTANGNSGIGIRTGPFDPRKSMATRPSMAAYEVQLLDDAGKKPSKKGSGSLYRYVAPSVNPVRAAPAWNTVEVDCSGPRIRVSINEQQALDVDQSTIADIKDKPLAGFISLQSHTNQVTFRNVWLREKKSSLR